jgi:ribosomal protein L3 glutamine methyltransferase
MNNISEDVKRNKMYLSLLKACREGMVEISDMIRLGENAMRKQKLHHHFLGNHTLLDNSKYLVYHVLNKHYIDDGVRITENIALEILSLFEQRIVERVPVEYITNKAYYLGCSFYVDKNVLVPRSIINTRFNDFLSEAIWENYRVLDLCTGSGCIGITLALMRPEIQVDLVDISSKALEVAQINIDNYSLNERVKGIHSDLFNAVENKYDLIITNPPYVSVSEYIKSPVEFQKEPEIALLGGADGLDIIHKILAQAKDHLNENGSLIAEVGTSAARRLKKQYPNIPFKWYKSRNYKGKESIFGMHGVFACKQRDLPDPS